MPFPFTLPTTSSTSLASSFSSSTHPSLPFIATTRRAVLKDALKKNKRLSPQDKVSHLSTVQDALLQYIPYLLALSQAAGYQDVGNERIAVEQVKPFVVEWRTTLSSSIPGREAPRAKLSGLHNELAFTLTTLAYIHCLLARAAIRSLYGSAVLNEEQRTSAITTGMKHLLQAHSIHTFLLSIPTVSAATDAPADIQASTLSGLASLALAEATLVVVTKDDPYATAVADDRNDNNTDWMFKAPSMPKVRAHLFARIALAAAEHARQARGLLSRGTATRLDSDLLKYADNLARTSQAKAIRFLAVNSDGSGSTGEALAYIAAAKRELGITSELESGKRKGFSGFKQNWKERREDRKVETGGEWGVDAGRFEETRVVEMLETKWEKENSLINVQVIPPYESLLQKLPSGREYHITQTWEPPRLDSDQLIQMRAPVDLADVFQGEEDDSGVDDFQDGRALVGAFPEEAPERSRTAASYY